MEKERQILYYQVAAGDKVERSTPDVIPSQGGGVELTRAVLGGEELWWTIGIEVFAPDARRFDVLEMIARLVFNHFPAGLQVGNSFSYPVLVRKYRGAKR
ncbi:MAG: hypothetical protein JW757_08100 [Anaerolineales bacterium]|nr:hypothetical protein [Anaerolineales bacterium]